MTKPAEETAKKDSENYGFEHRQQPATVFGDARIAPVRYFSFNVTSPIHS
jgi:hypothetical protein